MILVLSTGVNGHDFRIDQYENCNTTVPKVCNLAVINHEKSKKHQ